MTINESCDFFQNFPKILRKVQTIKDVGLGYITLGSTVNHTYQVEKLKELN